MVHLNTLQDSPHNKNVLSTNQCQSAHTCLPVHIKMYRGYYIATSNKVHLYRIESVHERKERKSWSRDKQPNTRNVNAEMLGTRDVRSKHLTGVIQQQCCEYDPTTYKTVEHTRGDLGKECSVQIQPPAGKQNRPESPGMESQRYPTVHIVKHFRAPYFLRRSEVECRTGSLFHHQATPVQITGCGVTLPPKRSQCQAYQVPTLPLKA